MKMNRNIFSTNRQINACGAPIVTAAVRRPEWHTYLREGDLGESELLMWFWLIWPLGQGKWGSAPAPE